MHTEERRESENMKSKSMGQKLGVQIEEGKNVE